MAFSTLFFVMYVLPLFFALYLAVPGQYKNAVALGFSLLFYLWGAPRFFLILLFSAAADYYVFTPLITNKDELHSQIGIWLGIAWNLGLLAYYKYANFFVENMNILSEFLGKDEFEYADIVLPIGLSFFTFQKITFLVDHYRDKALSRPTFQNYLLFIYLFPQLIAGPIVRYQQIIGQIKARVEGDTWSNRLHGFQRFVIGLFKKVVIADFFAQYADLTFDFVHDAPGDQVWVSVLAYSFQIYFDFSGYSDMAIGMARVMGFKLPENFSFPYLTTSFIGFWRKWHITLSSFMRDYLYIPLGGNRKGDWSTAKNLWIVFLLSGLWHGASWNFVLWGAFHGGFIAVQRHYSVLLRLPVFLGRMSTFFLVTLGWVLFRASTLDDALIIYKKLFFYAPSFEQIDSKLGTFFILFGAISVLMPGRIAARIDSWMVYGSGSKYTLIVSTIITLLALIYSIGVLAATGFHPFIYFRF